VKSSAVAVRSRLPNRFALPPTAPPAPPRRFAGAFLFEVRFGVVFWMVFFQTCGLTLVDFFKPAV